MNNTIKYITSESVSEGHPDKVADQISDALLDFFLTHDAKAHTAIETLVTTNNVIIAGETKSSIKINDKLDAIVRNVIKDIGYDSENFDWRTVKITNLLHEQSSEIYNSVSSGSKEGAGDQGTMFGYATNETPNCMPSSIYYAHRVLQDIITSSKERTIPKLGPDGKSQVTMRYKNKEVECIDNIIVSIQHPEHICVEEVKEIIYPCLIKMIPPEIMCAYEKILVNPSGSFINGGPAMDCGLTGRKIIVDTYGGVIPHGGGAFSGKDPTKVDRSAAYMARYLAKNIVLSGVAERCLVNLAYAIGIPEPTMVYIDTFGTNAVPNEQIFNFIKSNIDLSVSGIKKRLNLERPIYQKTAIYGHFGKSPKENGEFSWEGLDLVDTLQTLLQPTLSQSKISNLKYASHKV